jgi:hypothetical protein
MEELKMEDNKFDLKKSKSFFEMREVFEIRDFERKKELSTMRFDLAVQLATLLDSLAEKRHKERCEILGIKYIEPKRVELITNRVIEIKK